MKHQRKQKGVLKLMTDVEFKREEIKFQKFLARVEDYRLLLGEIFYYRNRP
jgi:hypothetical protein